LFYFINILAIFLGGPWLFFLIKKKFTSKIINKFILFWTDIILKKIVSKWVPC
jgi:hypothetical protein